MPLPGYRQSDRPAGDQLALTAPNICPARTNGLAAPTPESPGEYVHDLLGLRHPQDPDCGRVHGDAREHAGADRHGLRPEGAAEEVVDDPPDAITRCAEQG